jgi:hypothetical protein
MLHLDSQGYVLNARVQRTPRSLIEHGALQRISGIIVHQTGGASGASSLSSYTMQNANGAHFFDRQGRNDLSDRVVVSSDLACGETSFTVSR